MSAIIKFCNDNHWWLIAGLIFTCILFWVYGCVSTVQSLTDPTKKVDRTELQAELTYLVGVAKSREENLDRQDAVKQALLDAANIIGTSGTINPSGLINLLASIGGISFGLNRNQAAKKANATLTKLQSVA